MIVFEKNQPGRYAFSQITPPKNFKHRLANKNIRKNLPMLPQLSELEVVRHFTQLSKKNFCIDTQFYPLGSCTMKYNPRSITRLLMSELITGVHPLLDPQAMQPLLQCLNELQDYIKALTGLSHVALSPMAGAQGELAGVAMIKAYHHARHDFQRTQMLVPTAAHGTNPASAVMCGFEVKEIPILSNGDLDLKALKEALSEKTAGVMLTNPSTLGVFERAILEVSASVHQVGGLLYYDGANLNAILGRVRPGDMGFDVMHLNTHKTFATPHGGGGPGAGPIACNDKLAPFLPIPRVFKDEGSHHYGWLTQEQCPQSIGRLSAFSGNVGVLLRAYFYIRLLGAKGLRRVADMSTLNANYLMKRLQALGFDAAYPQRRATHEFIITLANITKQYDVTALDLAKRLVDFNIHAPTIYFPLMVAECLLIEPTETESKEMLDGMVEVMTEIMDEIKNAPQRVKQAPSRLPCKRLDEVKAAKDLRVTWENHK